MYCPDNGSGSELTAVNNCFNIPQKKDQTVRNLHYRSSHMPTPGTICWHVPVSKERPINKWKFHKQTEPFTSTK